MLIQPLPPGLAGISRTVAAIMGLAYDRRATVPLRNEALTICHGARTKDERARRIFGWVRDRLDYVHDPIDREFVQLPAFLARAARKGSPLSAGDCDDHACVILALCGAVGIEGRLCLSEDSKRPGTLEKPVWAHVWAEVRTERGWLPMDTSMKWLRPFSRVKGRRVVVYPADIPDFVVRRAERGSSDQLGFISALIQAGSSFINSKIGSRTAKALARKQAAVQMTAIDAQRKLAEKQMELTQSSGELAIERAERAADERRAVDAINRSRQTTKALVGLAVTALVVAAFAR